MSRYIDEEALGIGKADRNAFTIPEYADGWNSAIEIIANAPTADVVEVRHGEWKEHCANGYWHYDCPFCDDGYAMKEKDKTPPKYCSNCGAKMDGRREG